MRSIMARGLTLLEVLVAVAILGLGLTVILSSQVGLFSSSQRAENLTLATNLVRCRMNETEVELMRLGFQLSDQSDEGPCCEDEDNKHFRCSRKIETIELPQPASLGDGGLSSGDAGSGLDLSSAIGEAGVGQASPLAQIATDPASALGPMGALASIGQTGGAALGPNPSMGALSGLLSGAAQSGSSALLPMVMGMVYPDLKRMLEASIRRVTITIHWKEGKADRELSVTQFVTNPIQGGIGGDAAAGALQNMQAQEELNSATGVGTGTSTGTGTGTGPGTGLFGR